MGGRGASSGVSEGRNGKPGNAYGTQYKKLFEDGNIKFVEKVSRDAEPLLETMTRGRVYVTVGGKKDLLQIVYFDKENKRAKTIDLDHTHKGMNEHTHHGYYHYEYDAKNGVKKLATNLTPEEKRMVDRVRKLWYNHKHKR